MPTDRGNYRGVAPPVPSNILPRADAGAVGGQGYPGRGDAPPPPRRRNVDTEDRAVSPDLERRAAELLRKYPAMMGQNIGALRASVGEQRKSGGGDGSGLQRSLSPQYGGQRPASFGVGGAGAYRAAGMGLPRVPPMRSPPGGMQGARASPPGGGVPPSGVSRAPNGPRAVPRESQGYPPVATAQ
jgi:hypothetical protein